MPILSENIRRGYGKNARTNRSDFVVYFAQIAICPPECSERNSDPASDLEVPNGAGWAELQVRGDATPQLLMRILGLLAQQDRMPDRATIEKVNETLEVTIAISALPRHRAEVVAEKVRSMIGTHSVQLAWHANATCGENPYRR